MKNFRKKVSKKKLFSEYVRIMNGIFGLSKREAEVYSFMVRLDSEWRPLSEKDYKDILSTSNRKLIIRECNMQKTNLTRLVAELRNKGLIILNSYGGYEIPETLGINLQDGLVEIVFTLELLNDDGTGENN